MDYFLLVFFLFNNILYCFCAKSELIREKIPLIVKFGGIFEEGDVLQKIAFTHAVDSLNDNLQIEPPVKFVPVALTIPLVDSYKVFQKACDLMLTQVVTVFGPSTEPGTSQVRSICDAKEIPHVTTDFDYFSGSTNSHSFSLNLFPPSRTIGSTISAIVKYYDWRSFIVLYQDEQGLLRLQDLLHLSSYADTSRMVRTRRIGQKIQIGDRLDFKPLLKDIREILRESRIVVQADLETSRIFMEQAKDMDMTSEYYHYIFTSLDLYTLDFEIYKQSGCNVTALSLVDLESELTHDWIGDLRASIHQEGHPPMLPRYGAQTQLAVIYDSVHLIAQGVKRLRNSLVPSSVSCLNDGTWTNGTTFINFLKTINFEGTTGKVQFDSQQGNRFNLSLNVIELSNTGFEELGLWNESYGLHVTKNFTKSLLEAEQSLENKTLRVVVLLEDPFVMLKESAEQLTGNDRYIGFCIDLLDEIAKLKNFNYTIHEVPDKTYGVKDLVTGKWNGMVGELINKKADLAVSAFTVNYARSEEIDFTDSFMHLGISILFRRPRNPEPSLFSFLKPLSVDVWIYMLAAYIVVSLVLWLLARFSPYEWFNPHPCNPDNDVVENQFNLLNSFWFTVGSLMQQGSDLAPKATSTRLLAGVWWFFTLILISSYTANLAAFLTVERMVPRINSADDLVKQSKIKYGSLNRGSTMSFFRESSIPTYNTMWKFMSANPSVFVGSTNEGINKVMTEDYAFLMESAMIEYYIERNCELMQIGGQLDSKGYGIGLRKNSPWRNIISKAILQLQENTVLTSLKERWWKQTLCVEEKSGSGQANELGLKHVGGVFVFLLTGLTMSLIIGIVEFAYKSRHTVDEDKEPLSRAMWNELRFALQCKEEKPCKKGKVSTSALGYVDDGRGSFVPSFGFGYTAVPTVTESGLPKFEDKN